MSEKENMASGPNLHARSLDRSFLSSLHYLRTKIDFSLHVGKSVLFSSSDNFLNDVKKALFAARLWLNAVSCSLIRVVGMTKEPTPSLLLSTHWYQGGKPPWLTFLAGAIDKGSVFTLTSATQRRSLLLRHVLFSGTLLLQILVSCSWYTSRTEGRKTAPTSKSNLTGTLVQ